nr:hypothetical protein [Tanacetum cinerariifolium]
MVDELPSTRIGYATRTTLKSYTKDFEKKAQEERKLYIYVVDKSIKDTIKDEVKSLLPQILPKRDRNDKDKDEDPSAGSDRGLKKQKTSKDAEPPKGSKLKESKTSSSKGTKSQLKSSCKFVQDQLSIFLKEHVKASCHEYPFDLSNPLPLNEAQGRQVVPADYFFNNDLKYLKGGSSSRKYTTSTTKNKASKYDNIKGIKDMVLELWSPVKVAYDKLSMWGILHWSPK